MVRTLAFSGIFHALTGLKNNETIEILIKTWLQTCILGVGDDQNIL